MADVSAANRLVIGATPSADDDRFACIAPVKPLVFPSVTRLAAASFDDNA